MTTPLERLTEQGVALWLDDLSRTRITSGSLAELIRDRHVTGVTTNPSIFQNAIGGGDGAYAGQLRDLAAQGLTADEAVRTMTVTDVRAAADLLRPVFEATDGRDGQVSLEVDPRLAHRSAHTLEEARQLWRLVDRDNIMIKIPATEAGLAAIADALAEGISVNVTLIFSLQRYREVLDAYLTGLERARAAGLKLSKIESVASFFVSRLDTEIDRRLDKVGGERARALRGTAALANARLAYQAYEEALASERWRALAAAGARPQRPLWASTGVKDPAYDDTAYVVGLVAPDTVNTMPEGTLLAVADHGNVTGNTVTSGYDQARAHLAALSELGIDYDEIVGLLEREGVAKFESAWVDLLAAVGASLNSLR